MAGNDDDPVVLVPGVFGIVLGFVSPLILFGIVGLAWSNAGRISLFSWLLMALGTLILISTLFDQPRRIEMRPDGILRQCWLRSRLYPWSAVSALTRLPRRRWSSDAVSRVVGRESSGGDSGVGLMARVGRKRVLLLDKSERLDQWELMTSSVRRWSPGCGLPAKPYSNY